MFTVTHSAATQLCIPYKEVEIQAQFLKIQSYSHTVLSLVFTHMVGSWQLNSHHLCYGY